MNAQPVVIDCNKGKIALGHNGNLTNALELRRKLEHRGSIFQTTSDTEVIVHLIARSSARNLSGAIADALNQVEGAYSLLVLTRDEMYAIRDPRGFRPLCLGRLDGAWVAASETCAFDLIDAEYVREVEPGEMVRISRSGLESIRFAPEKPHQHCIFEHVYFSRPDSLVFGRPVNQSREQLGRLAGAASIPSQADIVAPVPDSGVPAAMGYRGRIRHSVSHGADPQSLRRPHVHRAGAGHPRFRREAETESRAANARGTARGAGGRFHRARHHQPEDRAPGARSGRDRSSRAHQLSAHDFALLLRRGHSAPRGTDRARTIPSRRYENFLARIRWDIFRSNPCARPWKIPKENSARRATPAAIRLSWCNSKWRLIVKADVDTEAVVPGERSGEERPVTTGDRIWREVVSWFWVILAFLFIEGTLVQARVIPSGSMENTVLIGDHLIVSRIGYDAGIPFTACHVPLWRNPKRQQIIVFRAPLPEQGFPGFHQAQDRIARRHHRDQARALFTSTEHALSEPYRAGPAQSRHRESAGLIKSSCRANIS